MHGRIVEAKGEEIFIIKLGVKLESIAVAKKALDSGAQGRTGAGVLKK